jgi:hypothetical protein
MPAFDLENYATVQERLAEFYQQFPDGSIRTFLSVRDGAEVIFEARVFRTARKAAFGYPASVRERGSACRSWCWTGWNADTRSSPRQPRSAGAARRARRSTGSESAN